MIRRFAARFIGPAVFCCLACALFGQEFSADLVTTHASGGGVTAKIFVGKDKVRIEPQQNGGMGGMGGGAVIMDMSTQTSVILMPERHMYVETLPGHGPQHAVAFFRPDDIDNACADWLKLARKPGGSCKKIGHESVNGRDTVKYEGTSAGGDPGDVWLDTKLKFVVKWLEAMAGAR